MKILWIDHPVNKALNNTTAHVPQTVADYAVAIGQAKYAPRANFGTPEWVSDRQILDSTRVVEPSITQPPPGTAAWSVNDKSSLSAYSVVTISKRVGAEITYYTTLPADAPPGIKRRFEELRAQYDTVSADAVNEQRYQEKMRQEVADKKTSVSNYIGSILVGKITK